MRARLDHRSLLGLAISLVGCGESDPGSSAEGRAGGAAAIAANGGETFSAGGSGGTTSLATGGAFVGSGGQGTGGAIGSGGVSTATGGSVATDGGSVVSSGGAPSNVPDAEPPGSTGLVAGVNVHPYPKPTAYGFVAADGNDRMGDALTALGAPVVRGGGIGDTTFLARLTSFGVKDVVLLLSASAQGKPFDPALVGPSLKKSLDAAAPLGLKVRVEGLNEWDLFNTRPYNAGVVPQGMSVSEFVLFTQKALYEAAHAQGVEVLGPSVGHPTDAANVALFPDVSAYVDIVNAHLYFTSNPERLPIASVVASHAAFQGSGKPVWVTETGVSSYGGVTPTQQADIIHRGLGTFAASHLIARAYIYELLENQLPGWSGSTYTPDSGEYHFGLFTYAGDAKPAASAFQDFAGAP